MKFNWKRTAAAVAGAALLAGVLTVGVSAAKNEADPAPAAAEAKVRKTAAETEKAPDGMVYVFTKGDGSVDKVVAQGLKDPEGREYKKKKANEELPVSIKVSYKLDGQEMEAKKLEGKSGLLTIRYDYENRTGAEGRTPVPFAAVTGLVLENDVFSQVTVDGGRMVDDGDRTLVLGVCFPGLAGRLDTDLVELPDHLEITARVEDLRLMNTMTLVTDEPFHQMDRDKFGDLDELTDSVEKLTDAMSALIEGSGKLKDGLSTLSEKTGPLSEGVTKLNEGAGALSEGAGKLDDGLATLSGGVGQLSTGLTTLSQNSAALNAGAEQVFATLLGEANKQLAAAGLELPELTRDNYAQVLNGAIDSLGEGEVRQKAEAVAREQVTAGVNAKMDDIRAGVTAAVREQVAAKAPEEAKAKVWAMILASQGLSEETFAQLPPEQQAALQAALQAKMGSDEVKAMIEQGIESTMQSEDILALIEAKTGEKAAELIEQMMASPDVQGKITEAINQANQGAGAISALKGGLDSYNQFYQGLVSYTGGVDTAKAAADKISAGAGELKKGSAALKDGAGKLKDGTGEMQKNMPALVDGVTKLSEGAGTLSEGLEKFDREGIQKLADAVNGDLKNAVDTLQDSLDAAQGYTGFEAGMQEGLCAKFLYRTPSIG